ncbi:influenza virus NS1A-binding protein-like isoform X3 [Dendronephthya gigantea]|uniref:influenza virus NS1A-binding protein-like isoform X3 n=1 Tax=Dendronephthya gigantea TaxID=151771 RepID=UPI00106CACA5|nr:influenza virus NS1A-binding protein-like isoform X3 [Dendronephthya gigantea]XP_028407077.1 influenza virus NS1A-binding protein-like isoform X3 [Dendronephthya gigantea]
MASYSIGYDDERFEQIVSQTLHCIICTNVIKDPVMCRHNEHVFCRGCITRHLMNSQTCPTCMEPLTVDTLKVPRTIANLLFELKISCEFFNRGCAKFVEMGDLEKHVAECGFAPAFCSNEGCGMEVNKQDLLHHETAVCEQRIVKCHSCTDIRREMDVVKVNMAAIKKKVDENYVNGKEVVAKVELVQGKLNKQEESNRRLEADNVEMKKRLDEITKQLERMSQQILREVQDEHIKKGTAEAVGKDTERMVVVAGGRNNRALNSVEMFNPATATWSLLQPMNECRQSPSSVIYNNQLLVTGGFTGHGWSRSMEKLSMNDIQDDHIIPWKYFPAELPMSLEGHCTVVHNRRLIVIGGLDAKVYAAHLNKISEIPLVPPYNPKLLTVMPQSRYYPGVAMFGEQIIIVGGRKNSSHTAVLQSVVMYDITKNECQELAPLPYPVSDMATVKWGSDSVIIMGGANSEGKALSKVLMYNIKTQKSRMLPNMKYKREGCVAAVVKDTVFVMGGQDERGNALKYVESFRFDRYSWGDLPDMHHARGCATAVACDVNTQQENR